MARQKYTVAEREDLQTGKTRAEAYLANVSDHSLMTAGQLAELFSRLGPKAEIVLVNSYENIEHEFTADRIKVRDDGSLEIEVG